MVGPNPGTRIAALDGWRGIAILLVLADHISDHVYHSWLPTGEHGVTAFFVLSGYLITGKLLEPDNTRIAFYIRRVFRLMPVAWSFLAVVWIAGLLQKGRAIPLDIPTCLLFVRNYFGFLDTRTTMHFWSLSIEEQFYIIWPSLLMFLGARRSMWLTALGAGTCYSWYLLHRPIYDATVSCFHTEVQATGLFVGCFLAILLQNKSAKASFMRLMRYMLGPLLAYLSWAVFQLDRVPSLLECMAWGFVIVYTTFDFSGIVSFSPLIWLGRISYSLYVWNVFVVLLWVRLPHSFGLRCLIILIPVASYYWIEKPGIKIGRHISRSVSPRIIPASGSRNRNLENLIAN